MNARWFWAAAVLLLFSACVVLKLHGSSIGRWQQLQQEAEPIRGLLLGEPKVIRSDEWVVWTPFALSQAQQSPRFPIENENIGAGRAPLLMSLPVAYYTTWFRPQLWGFFVFDVERAFSFWWCAKVFGLLLAMMWLLRQLGVESVVVVISGALWFVFSSFTQWWFSTPAMLPEMVASWAMCIGCVIAAARGAAGWRLALAAAGFLFFAVNFVLCLYPPYQIPLLYLGAIVLLGWSLEQRAAKRHLHIGRGLLFLGGGVLLLLVVLLPFWFEVRSTLEVVAQTEYPGGRKNTGGGYSWAQLFSGPVAFFESEQRVPLGFVNIAEGSNWYPLWLFAVAGVAVAWLRRRAAVSPLIVLLAGFIVVLCVYLTVPLPEWLLRVTVFSHVHEARALLALGVANVLLVCWFVDRYREAVFGRWWAVPVAVLFGGGIAAVFYAARDSLGAGGQLSLLIAVNAVIVLLFFADVLRRWLLLPVVALLMIASNGRINPLVQGLGALIESPAYRQVAEIHAADPSSRWIVFDDYVFAQLVKTTGAAVLNGTKIVPDLEFMRQLDPQGFAAEAYNRYAWIICTMQIFPEEVAFSLQQAEFYTMHLPPALPLLRDLGYNYYVVPAMWRDALFYDFELAAPEPAGGLWIYRRQR